MDRRQLKSSHEGIYKFIFEKTATDRWLGISSCYWRLCTLWNIAYILYFLEFCYIVWQDIISEETLLELTDALNHFHQYCAIFVELGINLGGISLLLQHSLVHYHTAIQGFGALNGLCSSITESKHIHAVKSPYRCSNYYKALCQMLLMNNCCNL